MRRAKQLVALLLAVILGMQIMPLVLAEGATAFETLTKGVPIPASASLVVEREVPEDAVTKTADIVAAAKDGTNVRAELSIVFAAEPEGEWAEGFANLVSELAQAEAQIEPGTFADAVLTKAAVEPPIEGALLMSVTVTAPYIEALQRGSRGPNVEVLQQKLVDLGFLEGKVDGQFGPKTAKGVENLQEHVRMLEQGLIDAMPQPTPLPPAEPDGEEVPVEKEKPVTALDGEADSALLAYLYSDTFSIASVDLAQGSEGAAVRRLQIRLKALSYMADSATGTYGPATARAVRLFQHYNDLPEDGIATQALQALIFSDGAKPAPHPMLMDGSKGEAVTALQTRLKTLGFMMGAADGDYGPSTTRGVKALQQYLWDKERQRLLDEAGESVEAGEDASAEPMPTPEPIDEKSILIVVDGVCDPLLQEQFFADDFPAIPQMMLPGSSGPEVLRLQRRLADLEYLFSSLDGAYGDATKAAVADFQKRNKLTEDGHAGAMTLEVLMSENAKKALKPYVLKISIDKQRVYAYAPDANEEYTKLVRTMKCSTGLSATPTPKGTFQNGTGPGRRWHYFKKFTCWAQYAFYIQGDIMFHSVLYGSQGGRVTQSSVNNLGRRASHGCVRLSVEDARWIWEHCPARTKVVVY